MLPGCDQEISRVNILPTNFSGTPHQQSWIGRSLDDAFKLFNLSILENGTGEGHLSEKQYQRHRQCGEAKADNRRKGDNHGQNRGQTSRIGQPNLDREKNRGPRFPSLGNQSAVAILVPRNWLRCPLADGHRFSKFVDWRQLTTEKISHGNRDVRVLCLQSKVARVEEMNFGGRIVSLECFRARG